MQVAEILVLLLNKALNVVSRWEQRGDPSPRGGLLNCRVVSLPVDAGCARLLWSPAHTRPSDVARRADCYRL